MEEYQQDTDVVEVNRHLLKELESMGFSQARAARALHHSGNAGIEAAVNWIIDHENDPDIDQMPHSIAVNIEIGSPQQDSTTEEMQRKAEELRNEARKKREEEEKKLEREREKERIRAGKEMLETKRIAEENERKRNIALRKAEKEEEQRARAKIRQKLEADKAERRRMLGLSPPNNAAAKPSEPNMQDNKIYHPDKSVTYQKKSVTMAEQLRECLRSLRRNHKDDDARVKRAFQTLMIYVGNVAKNPDVEKFRKIRVANPLFQERVGMFKEGTEFLELCGFEKSAGGEFLVLPRNKVDMVVLNEAGSQLKSAMTNPFFGLLSYGQEE